MNPGETAESPAQGRTQFQLQGDAADRYERWIVPFVIGPWAPGLLDLAALRRGHRVLDVATGTGVVARLAARQVVPGGTVTGLDLNEGMLTAARRLPLPSGLTGVTAVLSPYRSATGPSTPCFANRDYSSSWIG